MPRLGVSQLAGKGKIERFFSTCRAQFLPALSSADTRSLDALNARLVRPATDLDTLFRFRLKRRISKDRTVSLPGTLYEVDAALVGENYVE